MKQIYKYSVELSFFKLINSKNGVTKGTIDGNPAIVWKENENTVCSWSYQEGKGSDEEQRNNDFDVILQYRTDCND